MSNGVICGKSGEGHVVLPSCSVTGGGRSLMDTDEDGKISTHDLLTLMKSFGYHHTEVS